ncbi:hypothetical protein OHB00_02455 [Streptomyces sp. NBC_00631]|uniref:hypothetical protein n=1 Tax=Streptomyces sp. NBC_00631 TaxID=2975793 RepID=UPI0030E53E30
MNVRRAGGNVCRHWVLYNQYTDQCAEVSGTGADGGGTPVRQGECHNSHSGDNQVWGMLNTRDVSGNQANVQVSRIWRS